MISPFDGFSGLTWAGGGPLSVSTVAALRALARSLAGIPANASSADAAIAHIAQTFSVWAVPSSTHFAETMTGVTGSPSVGQFARSANGVLGTRSFGTATGDSAGVGLPWSAMALWSGTAFLGIIVWAWTGRRIDASGASVGTLAVNSPASMFSPTTGDNVYREVIPVIIDASGTLTVNGSAGPCGFQFSSAQAPTANGYYSAGSFSADDGVWGIHPTQCIDGDIPGAALAAGGYGFSNYNGSEPIFSYYWGGTVQSSSNAVGIVFSA